MDHKVAVLSDAELDAVSGGGLLVAWKSFNFQQNNAAQYAQNNQVAGVNVPIGSGQSNTQVVVQSNNIS